MQPNAVSFSPIGSQENIEMLTEPASPRLEKIASAPSVIHHVPRKPVPKESILGPFIPVARMLALTISDTKEQEKQTGSESPPPRKNREKREGTDRVISPRRAASHDPVLPVDSGLITIPGHTSYRQDALEPIHHFLEALLKSHSLHWCEEQLRKCNSENRRKIKHQLEGLLKREAKPSSPTREGPESVVSPKREDTAYPPPKQSFTRDRSRSLEKIRGLFFSKSAERMISPERKAVLSPKKERAISPNSKERPISPNREMELNPPRDSKHAISPRRQRPTSPSREERDITGLKERPSSARTKEHESKAHIEVARVKEKAFQAPIDRQLSPPRARIVEPLRLYKSELDSAQLKRVAELVKIIEKIQADQKNRYLLHAIEVNSCTPHAKKGEEVVPLWELLALSNESVISSEKLFGLIQATLRKKRAEPIAAKRLESYLKFCLEWVQVNQQTKLYSIALPYLKEIAQHGTAHTSSEAKVLAGKLEERFALLTAPLKRLPLERSDSVSKFEFKALLNQVTSGELNKPYEAQAELLSIDLYLQLRQIFKAITMHDLIQNKWDTKFGKSVVVYTDFFNKFAEFIADSLLQKGLDAHKRACIVKLFVHVAFKSASFGDMTTPMMIVTALSFAALDRLKTMKRLLDKDQFDLHFLRETQPGGQFAETVSTNGAFEILKETFTAVHNSIKLRNLQAHLQKGNSCVITYLPLVQGDLTRIEENAKVKEAENCYNFDKLRMIQEKIQVALFSKDKPAHGKICYELFETDLFLRVFKDVEPDEGQEHFTYPNSLSDEARYDIATLLEKTDAL